MSFAFQLFFEDLNPFSEMSEKNVNDVLYDGSLSIEPRGSKQPPKFVSILFQSMLKLHLFSFEIYQLLNFNNEDFDDDRFKKRRIHGLRIEFNFAESVAFRAP